jgi:DNA-binding NarL/FixJ family response regulator
MIKVLIVDDNFVVRRGLCSFLEAGDDIMVVGEASTGSEAVSWVREMAADVILMDIRMSGIDGIESTRQILREHPDVKVLMLTVVDDPVFLARAILAGARGYLVYGHFAPASLKEAIKKVVSGGVVYIPPVSTFMEANGGAGHAADGEAVPVDCRLTGREEEIMRLIATGKENREIASALHIEEKTVKNHINNIYSKINVGNRQEAIFYMINRWLKDEPV